MASTDNADDMYKQTSEYTVEDDDAVEEDVVESNDKDKEPETVADETEEQETVDQETADQETTDQETADKETENQEEEQDEEDEVQDVKKVEEKQRIGKIAKEYEDIKKISYVLDALDVDTLDWSNMEVYRDYLTKKLKEDLFTARTIRQPKVQDPEVKQQIKLKDNRRRPAINEEDRRMDYIYVDQQTFRTLKAKIIHKTTAWDTIEEYCQQQARFQYYHTFKNFSFAKRYSKAQPPEFNKGKNYSCMLTDTFFETQEEMTDHFKTNLYEETKLIYERIEAIAVELYLATYTKGYVLDEGFNNAFKHGVGMDTSVDRKKISDSKFEYDFNEQFFSEIDTEDLGELLKRTYEKVMKPLWPETIKEEQTPIVIDDDEKEKDKKEEESKESKADENKEEDKEDETDLKFFWCEYCKIQFQSKEEINQHRTSDKFYNFKGLLEKLRKSVLSYWIKKHGPPPTEEEIEQPKEKATPRAVNQDSNKKGINQRNNQGNNQRNNQGNNQRNNQGNNQRNNQGNNQRNNQGNNQRNNQRNNQGNNQGNKQQQVKKNTQDRSKLKRQGQTAAYTNSQKKYKLGPSNSLMAQRFPAFQQRSANALFKYGPPASSFRGRPNMHPQQFMGNFGPGSYGDYGNFGPYAGFY